MNKRIRELAEQADAHAWQQIDEGADYDKQPQYFAERFAELIVRECAAVGFEAVANGDLVEDSILEHFGVEQ